MSPPARMPARMPSPPPPRPKRPTATPPSTPPSEHRAGGQCPLTVHLLRASVPRELARLCRASGRDGPAESSAREHRHLERLQRLQQQLPVGGQWQSVLQSITQSKFIVCHFPCHRLPFSPLSSAGALLLVQFCSTSKRVAGGVQTDGCSCGSVAPSLSLSLSLSLLLRAPGTDCGGVCAAVHGARGR